MLIFRALFMLVVLAFILFTAMRVLSNPLWRRQVINRRTIKQSTFLLISSVLAALVVGFIFTAEQLF